MDNDEKTLEQYNMKEYNYIDVLYRCFFRSNEPIPVVCRCKYNYNLTGKELSTE